MSAWKERKCGSALAASKKKCTCLEEGTEGLSLCAQRGQRGALCSCSYRQRLVLSSPQEMARDAIGQDNDGTMVW